jgi:catalase
LGASAEWFRLSCGGPDRRPAGDSGSADPAQAGFSTDANYRQPGDLFRLMSADQKQQLFHNYKAAMEGVPVEIIKRQIAHCYKADSEYGVGVAKALGVTFSPRSIAAE